MRTKFVDISKINIYPPPLFTSYFNIRSNFLLLLHFSDFWQLHWMSVLNSRKSKNHHRNVYGDLYEVFVVCTPTYILRLMNSTDYDNQSCSYRLKQIYVKCVRNTVISRWKLFSPITRYVQQRKRHIMGHL